MLAVLRSVGFKVFGAIGLMLLVTLVYAEEHNHNPSQESAKQVLKPGEKWQTDAPLRQGMDNIRQVMTASQQSIEKGLLGAQDYHRLAEAVNKNVTAIVQNCKLSKEADTAFHNIVLADLTGGTELMLKSPKIQMQRVGALGVLQSLRNYGKYFQHPGWSLTAAKEQ